jgi:hypothetical protein
MEALVEAEYWREARDSSHTEGDYMVCQSHMSECLYEAEWWQQEMKRASRFPHVLGEGPGYEWHEPDPLEAT